MQCSRCFFDNPADARWCGYCGHAFAAPDGAEGDTAAGRAARKRATRLGVVPDDPFAAVADSLRGGAAAPVPPPRAPTPPRPARSIAPKDDPARRPAPTPEAPASPARRRRHQATIVEGEVPDSPPRAEVLGVVLIFPESGPPTPHLLRAGTRRVGRDPDNDIRLDDPRASGHHAIVRVEPGGAWLLDTSTNGTVVNGSRVRADRAALADGAIIEVGRTVLVVQLLSEDTLAMVRGRLA